MSSARALRSVKENQPTKEGPTPTEPAGKKKAVWSPEDDKALLYCLLEQQAAGNQGDNGWKKVVWTAAVEALKDNGGKGGSKTWTSCRDRFKTVSLPIAILSHFSYASSSRIPMSQSRGFSSFLVSDGMSPGTSLQQAMTFGIVI